MLGFNSDLLSQMNLLRDVIQKNETVYKVVMNAQKLTNLNYYIGAGCIAQTVWNYQTGNDFMYGISDIDFVYYDADDLSEQAENEIAKNIVALAGTQEIKIDVKNEARVHLWYKGHFGYDISPYTSLESAINTWPTTATSIGVRLENGEIKIYAPFGLNDLFGLIVKANKAQITADIYKQKVDKWKAKWTSLKVIPW